jgi:hypothetical protein
MSIKKSRPKTPRIAPLPPAEIGAEFLKIMNWERAPEKTPNVMATFANYPALMKHYLPFSFHLLRSSSLTKREVEILVLRTIGHGQPVYALHQHRRMARDFGLGEAEIESLISGDGMALPEPEQILVKAADELFDDQCVSDATWAILAQRYNKQQLMDLVFTVANYVVTSMAFNSFGIQVEDW